MGRMENSWQIVRASGRVLRQDKELIVLPVVSFLASLLIMALVVGVGWRQGWLPEIHDAQRNIRPVVLLVTLLAYLVLAFVNVFFAAAVVAGASERLAGGNPTVGSSLRAAARHWRKLLAWAAITATVSLVLQMLRERGGLAGKLFGFLGSMAWSLATYFVVPVLLFEETRMKDSIGRAGGLFKKTWGETVLGTGGVGLVFTAAMFGVGAIAFVAVAGMRTRPLLGLSVFVVCLVAFIGLSVLQSAFSGVYKAALYRYASTGQAPEGFTPPQVQGAFLPR